MSFFGSITRQSQKMVIVLLVGAVLVVLNQTFISPALPTIMNDMNVDETTVQWLTSAFALVEAIVIPLTAFFMGQFKVNYLFCGCIVLFSIGSLVCVVAPVFGVLLTGRILQAAAAGVLMTMVVSVILVTFPKEHRGQAMGLVSLIMTFAPAVGPAIGGVLIDSIGWRALFLVVMILAICVVIYSLISLRTDLEFARTHFDVLSVILSTVGLAALLYGISSFTSGNLVICIILIVVGLAMVLLFAWRQTRLDKPMLEVRVLKSRRYSTGVVANMLLMATLTGSGVLMPLYVQEVLGESATVSGLVVLPGALLGAILALFAGRLFDRMGVRIITIVGAALILVGGVGMIFYQADSPLWFVIFANVMFAGFLQFLITPITTWGLNSLDTGLVQHATSFTNTVNQVGSSLGTALIISFAALGSSMSTATGVANTFDGYHLSFITTAVLLAIVFLIVLFLVRDRKKDTVLSIAVLRGEGEEVADVALSEEAAEEAVDTAEVAETDAKHAEAEVAEAKAEVEKSDKKAKHLEDAAEKAEAKAEKAEAKAEKAEAAAEQEVVQEAEKAEAAEEKAEGKD